MTRIIETNTIEIGDLIAFRFGAKEAAGLVKGFTDCGDFIVKTLGLGVVNVRDCDVTDIA